VRQGDGDWERGGTGFGWYLGGCGFAVVGHGDHAGWGSPAPETEPPVEGWRSRRILRGVEISDILMRKSMKNLIKYYVR
jgi:hypothetical protein